jgi:hypothetical protein
LQGARNTPALTPKRPNKGTYNVSTRARELVQMEHPPTHWVHLAILRVINLEAKLHMDMLVSMDVLKAPALWRQIRVRRYSSQSP